jgi:hypothetical protein
MIFSSFFPEWQNSMSPGEFGDKAIGDLKASQTKDCGFPLFRVWIFRKSIPLI